MRKIVLLLLLITTSIFAHAADPLPGNEVFIPKAKVLDPNTVVVNWQIKPGYFLYKDRVKVTDNSPDLLQLGRMTYPPALTKKDSQLGTYSIYRDNLDLAIPILGNKAGKAELTIHYQGCADSGFCYPPMDKTLQVTISKKLEVTKAVFLAPPKLKKVLSETEQINSVFTQKGFLLIVLTFFGFGLLLSFTPCVLPMVPVLSGIIVGHGKDITTKKAFLLSLSYVLSMSLTYAIAGIIVAAIGSNIQAALQTPAVIISFSIIFILLALSMFGFYELKLPVSWQTKLSGLSRKQHAGHYLGAAIMGALSSLILSPCITAPLIGALSYIANTGDMILGGISLFFLGLGMGAPLLVIGASAGKLLPKAGGWMNAVKAFFGVMLLGVAIFLLSRIIPEHIIMLLWASLLIITAIYLGALHSEPQNNGEKFFKGVGIIMLFYGGLLIVGAGMGNGDPLLPLEGVNIAKPKEMPVSQMHVKTVADVKRVLADNQGKPVVLDFYADWCSACKIMEKTTFKDPSVTAAMKRFIWLKADVTANDNADKALEAFYNVVAPPTFIFFDKDGKEIQSARIVGEKNAEQFLKILQSL